MMDVTGRYTNDNASRFDFWFGLVAVLILVLLAAFMFGGVLYQLGIEEAHYWRWLLMLPVPWLLLAFLVMVGLIQRRPHG